MITIAHSLPRYGILFFAAVASVGCNVGIDFGGGWKAEILTGNGSQATEQRDVERFEKIAVHGAIEVVIENGEEPLLELEADENLLPIIETKVESGLLTIRTTQNYSGSIKVKATAQSLNSYEGTGATTGELLNPNSEVFNVSLSGASTLKCGEGAVQKLVVDATGVSKFLAPKLSAVEVEAHASGASTIQVQAVERLAAKASGASSIEYGGSPKVVESKSGASSINRTK
jgi:hypothetical protein